MSNYIFDIETNNLYPKVSRMHCMVLADSDTGEVYRYNNESKGSPSIDEGLARLSTADTIIGHNVIGFDLPCIQKLTGWVPPESVKIRDTLVCSRLIYTNMMERDIVQSRKASEDEFPLKMAGKHSLKAWGYRLGILKGLYLESHGFDVWTEELEDYCEQDVLVTQRLWKEFENQKYSEVSLELEHRFAAIMFEQEQHGFCFDVQKANALYADLATEKITLDQEMQDVFPPKEIQMKMTFWRAGNVLFDTKSAAKAAGHKDSAIERGPNKVKRIPFNSGSRDHIAERLQQLGWNPKDYTEGGKPKVDETILTGLPYPEAQMLAKILTLQKRMGQLGDGRESWLKLEYRGRIHGHVVTNGAVTGRCTHRHPNMAQVPREGRYRALFKATDGKVLVGCDASGLELRCLAHYMNDEEYTRKLLDEDIHTVNQEAAGLPTRDNAKTFIYGFLYGAGNEKIGQIIGKGSTEGKQIREKFLKSLPSLGVLKQKISKALENKNWLKGLDGRQLHVRSEHSALNTLLQSAGAVVMKQATVLLYDKLVKIGMEPVDDFMFVAHVHDEFQVECWPELSQQVADAGVASIREAGECFKFRCPLDGESKIGHTWAETH